MCPKPLDVCLNTPRKGRAWKVRGMGYGGDEPLQISEVKPVCTDTAIAAGLEGSYPPAVCGGG